ncbi:MAG: CoA transferase [Rhodobiaceae bacterium]|nr:CoA transferase [Rhodobiaceae bacterium]MCC0054736.1 CoA transferase [Rhodobiaceae bacterium]
MSTDEIAVQEDALGDVRVLDLTTMIAGPYCTRMLADLGADVIKIEAKDGDYMRNLPPLKEGASRYFGHLNAGKRSISMDLKSPEAVEIVKKLCNSADVLVENGRPGVMDRLGLGYDAIAAINPRIIYCSISGYGQSGPKSKLPAYAPMVTAASGFDMTQMGLDRSEMPPVSSLPTADILGAVYAASGIQSALYHRERTGLGQRVDTTLIESMLNLLLLEMQVVQQPLEFGRARYRPIRANDGYVMVVPVNANNFANLCKATGHEEWLSDPRFAKPPERVRNYDTLMEELQKWTIQRSGEECEKILLGAGVPASRYRTVEEAMSDPQLTHRGSFPEVEDAAGTFRVVNAPSVFSRSGYRVRSHVPRLGEHTETVLRELGGLDDAEIQRLRASGNVFFG